MSRYEEPYQFDFELELIRTSDDAILVQEAGVDPAEIELNVNKWWIPRSQIVGTDLEEVGDTGELEITGWLAHKLGLTDD